jgi:hypothetical protein
VGGGGRRSNARLDQLRDIRVIRETRFKEEMLMVRIPAYALLDAVYHIGGALLLGGLIGLPAGSRIALERTRSAQ